MSKTLSFEKFDQVAYEMFAGATGWENGYEPMLAENGTVNVHGTAYDAMVVLDATGIEVVWVDDEMNQFAYKLPLVTSFTIALGVASNLPQHTNVTNLETLGFQKILG